MKHKVEGIYCFAFKRKEIHNLKKIYKFEGIQNQTILKSRTEELIHCLQYSQIPRFRTSVRETKNDLRNRIAQEIWGKIKMFGWGEETTFGSNYLIQRFETSGIPLISIV